MVDCQRPLTWLALDAEKIARHSFCPRRDIALLMTQFSSAAKPLELAQLEIRDYIEEVGHTRQRSAPKLP